MLAIRTVGRPVVGFFAGLSVGALAILGMNDIVYDHFMQKLYGPVKLEVEQGATTSEDFSRITRTAAQSSKEFMNTVKPFGISKVNVKKLFIEDEDYSTPEDHYFSYLRRRKEQEMLENGAKYGPADYFEEPKWQDTHQKEDYQKLGESTLKDVFGAPMGIKNAKLISEKKGLIDEEEEYVRMNPQFARDSEDFDSRNQFGFFKITEAVPQPLQRSPQKLRKKVSKSAETVSLHIPGVPKFNLAAISNYIENPSKMKGEIKALEKKLNKPRNQVLKNPEKPRENLMMQSIQSVLSQTDPVSNEFKVMNQGVGIASLSSNDKKRLHKLATKARYQ